MSPQQTTPEQDLAAAVLKTAGDADVATLRAAFALALAQRASERQAKPKPGAGKPRQTDNGPDRGERGPGVRSGAKASEDDEGTRMGLHPEAITSYAQARPDVMLAEAAAAIAEAEGIDPDAAMLLAVERDSLLRFRYGDMQSARERARGALVKPPKGLRLCECAPDVELAERAQALAARESIGEGEAMRRLLADDAKLASRYRDHTRGESALDELAYRVDTLVSANEWRMSEAKAVDLVLHEDAVLKAAVLAYFEPKPYTSPAA